MASERALKEARGWLETCSDHRGEQILSLAELLDAGDASGYARGLEEASHQCGPDSALEIEILKDHYEAVRERKEKLQAELAELRSQLQCGHLKANWVEYKNPIQRGLDTGGKVLTPQAYALFKSYCTICRQQAERNRKLLGILNADVDWEDRQDALLAALREKA